MKTNTPIKLIQTLALGATLLFIATCSSSAHSVYIEPTASGDLIARFAEFGDDDYETSPGHLDSLEDLSAWKHDGEDAKVLAVEKKKDHFTIADVLADETVQLETGFPAMTSGSGPGRKPHFYARWRASDTEVGTASATLDLVPTGKPGEIRVWFRGKPLAGVEATLFTPEANDQELKSDAEGLLKFNAPDEKGLFMLKVGRYREERVGFSKGTEFGLVSHNSVITWVRK